MSPEHTYNLEAQLAAETQGRRLFQTNSAEIIREFPIGTIFPDLIHRRDHLLGNQLFQAIDQQQFGIADTLIQYFSSNRFRARNMAILAGLKSATGLDARIDFDRALGYVKAMRPGPGRARHYFIENKIKEYSYTVSVMDHYGLIEEADAVVEGLEGEVKQGVLDELDLVRKGQPIEESPEQILAQRINQIRRQREPMTLAAIDKWKQDVGAAVVEAHPTYQGSLLLAQAYELFHSTGRSPETIRLIEEAKKIIQKYDVAYEISSGYTNLALLQVEMGAIKDAMRTLSEMPVYNDSLQSTRLIQKSQIAYTLLRQALTPSEIQTLDQESVMDLLRNSNNNNALQSLGYHHKDSESVLSDPQIPTPAKISYLIGVAESTSDKSLITEARRILVEQPTASALKAYTEGVIDSLDYESASNNLLGVIYQFSREGRTTSAIRILKGLTEINNPKGNHLATLLFADSRLPIRYRQYLMNKLLHTGYWDKNLALYLKEDRDKIKPLDKIDSSDAISKMKTEQKNNPRNSLSDEDLTSFSLLDIKTESTDQTEQFEILSILISKFGIVPSLSSYQLLEGPGTLIGETLTERVEELQTYKEVFNSMPREQLIPLLLKDSAYLNIYYLLKAGEQSYSLINGYSIEKFRTTLEKINELRIDEKVLTEFKGILQTNGHDEEKSEQIIRRAILGQPLISSSERTIPFSTEVEYGASQEILLEQLQFDWSRGLRSLLIQKANGYTPTQMAESMLILEDQNLVDKAEQKFSGQRSKVGRIYPSLKLDQQISLADIYALSRDFRSRLIQVAGKDREQRERIRQLSDTGIILDYLRSINAIPDGEAVHEWQLSMEDTIDQLAQQDIGTKVTTVKDVELTFLDKSLDFIRSIRFADASRCCFNSSDENFNQRTYEYVTRLQKDPLSFIIDLKYNDSKEVMGFVFGRLGFDPETKGIVIMLNGVYSQLKGQMVVDNILKIIEEQMGAELKAQTITIASQYGGRIPQPTGYDKGSRSVHAVRALKDKNGVRERTTYDDIGTIANGVFTTTGYFKDISAD